MDDISFLYTQLLGLGRYLRIFEDGKGDILADIRTWSSAGKYSPYGVTLTTKRWASLIQHLPRLDISLAKTQEVGARFLATLDIGGGVQAAIQAPIDCILLQVSRNLSGLQPKYGNRYVSLGRAEWENFKSIIPLVEQHYPEFARTPCYRTPGHNLDRENTTTPLCEECVPDRLTPHAHAKLLNRTSLRKTTQTENGPHTRQQQQQQQ